MGPMLLLVLGLLSAVGLGLYQFSDLHRFDLVPDSKGGIFIIDRKSAAINHCDNKTCTLVGNGSLPSQIMNNPAAMMNMQGAIMGAPAKPVAAKPGVAPASMKPNMAASGEAKPEADAAKADGEETAATPADEGEEEAPAVPAEDSGEETPEGFDFN